MFGINEPRGAAGRELRHMGEVQVFLDRGAGRRADAQEQQNMLLFDELRACSTALGGLKPSSTAIRSTLPPVDAALLVDHFEIGDLALGDLTRSAIAGR